MVPLAKTQPWFAQEMNGLFDGRFVPVQGAVPGRDRKVRVIGAVGVSGDTPPSDAACALAGIEAAGLTPEA